MFRPQLITINCAHCGVPFQLPVFSIIDAKQNPELKQALLGGRLNSAPCPSCGQINYIGGPMLYHDPAHEFLATYIPMEANLPESERQKIIGDLTNALMKSLPAEERRGYMLTPSQFFDMKSLVRKILALDGITDEMMENSRRKLDTLKKLLSLQSDAMAFNMAVAENKDLLDREFFMLIADAIEYNRSQGQEPSVKELEALRERLLPLTDFGQRLLKQRQAVAALGEKPSQQQVLDAILAGDMDEVEAITVAVLPMLDYNFFQSLTDLIEKTSDPDQKESLEAKRDLILNVMDAFRKMDEQAYQAAADVADVLIKADDLEQAIIEMAQMIDERVLDVLLHNLHSARQQGASELAERIQQVLDALQKAIDSTMPPHMALVLDLVAADYPKETKQLLTENKDMIDDDFLALLEVFISDVQQSNSYDPKAKEKLSRHLRNVIVQARLVRGLTS